MTKQVDETLAKRGKHYGDFVKTFDVIQQIKDAMKDGIGWAAMPPERRKALEMIAVKLGRLVSGDSGHADSWHDIAGYARLVEESLPGDDFMVMPKNAFMTGDDIERILQKAADQENGHD